MNSYYEAFIKRLSQYRIQLNLTQEKASQALGITQKKTVGYKEQDEKKQVSILIKLKIFPKEKLHMLMRQESINVFAWAESS